MADGFSYDEFTQPAEGGTSYDEFSGTPKALDRREDQSDATGIAKNVATGALKAVAHVPGIFGDVPELGRMVTSNIQSIWDPRSAPQIRADQDKRRAAAMKKMEAEEGALGRVAGWVERNINAPTGHDIYEWAVKPHLGEYEPETTAGRIGQAAVEGMLPLPGGKTKTGARILEEAPNLIEKGLQFLRARKPQVMMGTSGAAGQSAYEATGQEGAALLAGAAAPVGLHAVGSQARRMVPSVTKEGAARTAANEMVADMRKHGEDPQAALDRATKTYDEMPADWGKNLPDPDKAKPSLAEATGSATLTADEAAARLVNPNSAARFKEMQDARGAAREEQIKTTIDPNADPMAATREFTKHLDELDKRVDQAMPATPDGATIGETQRGEILAGREAAEKARTTLYSAIPEDMNILPKSIRERAQKIIKDFDPEVDEPTAAHKWITKAASLPEVMTFDNFRKFMRNINGAMKSAAAGAAPDHIAAGQLKSLYGAVRDDMRNAVRNQMAYEAEQVANGQLNPNKTLAANIQRQRDEWLAAKQMAGRGETFPGNDAASQASGAGPVGGISHAAENAGSGGDLGGAGGLSGRTPNMDPAAVKALEAANEAQSYLGKTYREGVPAQMLATNGYAGRFKIMDGTVPRKAFPGGDNGYQVTKQVLEAGKNSPEMIQAMQDTAVMTLREQMKGGRLTPQALQAWKHKFRGSLAAIDEANPGFTNRFENIANTQSEIAAKFVGMKTPEEAASFMGHILRQQDAPTLLRNLREEARGNPDVWEGMKNLAVADMTSLEGARLRDYIRKRRPALQELFDPDHLNVMERVASDFDAHLTHQGNLKNNMPGSPTAAYQQTVRQRFAPPEPVTPSNMAGAAGMFSLFSGNFAQAAGAFAAQTGLRAMNKIRSLGVNNINDLRRRGLEDKKLGMAMLRHGIADQPGSPSWLARVADAMEKSPLYMRPELDTGEKNERARRASGGAVGVDTSRAAQHLTGLVARARRGDQAKTKELLGAHDDMVARALAVANRSVG